MSFFEVRSTDRQNVYRYREKDINLEKSKYREKNEDLKLPIAISFVRCLYISVN